MIYTSITDVRNHIDKIDSELVKVMLNALKLQRHLRLIRQLRSGNSHLAVTYGRPDETPFFKAFGEEVQAVCICPRDFDGIAPAATEDKQAIGEGGASSTCCICSPSPLKDLRISVTPATSQIRVPDGREIIV